MTDITVLHDNLSRSRLAFEDEIHQLLPVSVVRHCDFQHFHLDWNNFLSYPFLENQFKRVAGRKERMQVIEETGPAVIFATSGMLVGGPSVEYLKHLADNPKNSLIFTCYLGEGTLGRRVFGGE